MVHATHGAGCRMTPVDEFVLLEPHSTGPHPARPSLLQGPEAVTFDNVTLAHFLDKAERLAACAEDIKALDAQV